MLKNNIILQYHYIPIYNFKIFKGKMINENSKNIIMKLLAYQYITNYLSKR